MSSERAGVHTSVGLRSKVQYMLIELARKADGSGYQPGDEIGYLNNIVAAVERAGTPTHGTLNREQAREVMREYDYENFANADQVLDALEACVVPDPRIARIEAELDRHERETRLTERGELHLRRLRAILRGDQ